jgi:hypothetical protein
VVVFSISSTYLAEQLPTVLDACSYDAGDDERWLEVATVVILSG